MVRWTGRGGRPSLPGWRGGSPSGPGDPGQHVRARVTVAAAEMGMQHMLFDCENTTNENVYKLLVATIVPRPIAWVTTQDVDGTLNAAPFSFFNAMSGNPPVVAIGIGGRAPGDVKDTGGNIRRTGQFVVNLVSDR